MPLPAGLTNIPPKRLALIAAGGVGAGLLWRYLSARKTTTTQLDADGNPIDVSKLALGQNSAGNLAASQPVLNPNDAVRNPDTGTFPLPVTRGIITGADGIDYLIDPDGHVLGPLYPKTPAAPATPGTPAGTTPTYTPPPVPEGSNGTWTQAYHDWFDLLHTRYPSSGYDTNLNVGDPIPTDWQHPQYYSYLAAKAVADRGYI